MSQVPAHHTLKRHIEPISLNEAGLLGSSVYAALSFIDTRLPKRGISALLARLPMVSRAPVAMDIDLACVLFDKAFSVIDSVWYGQIRLADGSVRHQGDALSGAANFEESLINQEEIRLWLDELSDDVHHIAFIITSFHQLPLYLAKKAEARFGDNENHIAHRFSFDELDKNCQALMSWHLAREQHDWRLYTLMQPLTVKKAADKHIDKLSAQAADILKVSQAQRW